MQNDENLIVNENSKNPENIEDKNVLKKFYKKIDYYKENLDKKYFDVLIIDIDKYSEISYKAINNNIKLYSKIINTILSVFDMQISVFNIKNSMTVFERACIANIYYYLSRSCDLSYKDISYLLNKEITEQYISYIINMYIINVDKLNIGDKIKEKIKENNKKIKEQFRTLI